MLQTGVNIRGDLATYRARANVAARRKQRDVKTCARVISTTCEQRDKGYTDKGYLFGK